ncbi:uncharacterized protein LOC111612896 [Centruroides sculpturatus]|uniref:uncharacterized protein LOC111612896 n=1 Tax=Centruroides sculpturatus TaxID=218467 RepID=UPI000C6DD736|nr:uncharacterized protein LOC111612896 [Centruroides sculpturatus]
MKIIGYKIQKLEENYKNNEKIKEIKQFINEELGLKNIEIEGLVQLKNSKNNLIIKVILESVKDRNLVLKRFWTLKPKIVNETEKKIIITTDLCIRSRIRRKKLQDQIKVEKTTKNKILIRDDYYIKDNIIYTIDMNTNKILQMDCSLRNTQTIKKNRTDKRIIPN